VIPLERCLKDNAVAVRQAAAMALAELGDAAKDAVPGLAAALKDPDVTVRATAAGALAEIGPVAGDAIPALVAALKDSDIDVRGGAAYALGEICVRLDSIDDARRNRSAITALSQVLKDDPEASVRTAAADAIGKLQAPAEQ
jgi:HEAT repeat protein